MTYLVKTGQTEYIPGTPGTPGYPGAPARPAWVENTCSLGNSSSVGTITETHCYTIPTIIDLGNGSYTILSGCHTTTSSERTTSPGSSGLVYNTSPGNCLVYHPATAAIPPTPATHPTPAQIIINNRQGWNSVAWTVDTIDEGDGFKFKVKGGSRGVLIGLSQDAGNAPSVSAFKHALLIDQNGASVLESGSVVATLPYPLGYASVERSQDGKIIFSTSESSVRLSQVTGDDIYLAVMLYQSDDGIHSFEWYESSSLLQPAYVSMSATSSMVVANEGAASVSFYASGSAEFYPNNGEVEFYARAIAVFKPTILVSVNATFPAFECHAGNAFSCYVNATFPAFECSAWQEEFTPATPNGVSATFPAFQCVGICTPGTVATVNATFPAFACKAGDKYGDVEATFPAFVALSYAGGNMLNVEEIDLGLLFTWFDATVEGDAATVYYDVSITSTLGISTTFTGSLSMLGSIIATLTASTTMDGLLSMYESIVVRLINSDTSYATVEGSNAVQSEQVWVLNLDSGATSRYDNYGFNSHFVMNGKNYGVADDGIYELTGDSDAGDEIAASLKLAISQLDSVREKRSYSAYVAAASGDEMILKVVVDGGTEYTYTARSSSSAVQTHRIDIGRGLKGTHWQFTLINQNGCDFDLQSLEFLPIEGKRRI